MRVGHTPVSALTACLLCGVATAALAQDTRTYTYDTLGRLIEQQSTGSPNNGEVHSICYDPAGNRTQYRTSNDGSSAGCDPGVAGSAPTPTPSPTPTPTPPPSNNPPVTVNDSVSGACNGSTLINVTTNDSDPEGNYPLVLQSVTKTNGGGAFAVSYSGNIYEVFFSSVIDTTTFTYTVADSLGATATGQLTVNTTSCGGGGGGMEF